MGFSEDIVSERSIFFTIMSPKILLAPNTCFDTANGETVTKNRFPDQSPTINSFWLTGARHG
jgi:hypothetical protein